METIKKRSFGLDCLKVMAIIFIPSLHFCSYFFQAEDHEMTFLLYHFFRWLFFTGPGLFLTISGYLYANKKFSKKYFISIIGMLAIFFVYCVLDVWILHDNFTFGGVLYYFTNFPAYYWYMQCWLITLFFVPFLNEIIANINVKQYFGLLAVSMFVISIPSALAQLNDIVHSPIRIWQYYTSENFPILYYLIGAGFRKFQFQFKKSICILVITLSLTLNAVEDIIYCKMYLNPFGDHLFTNNYYANPFTVCIIFMLFALLYRVDTKSKHIQKLFEFISSISLEMYLGLMIADTYAGALVEKSIPIIEKYQLSYIFQCIPWIFGELIVTLFFAILVRCTFTFIKRLFDILYCRFNCKKAM